MDVKYGYSKTLSDVNFDDALLRVEDALKTLGFGVLTRIDVKETFDVKLGADFRNYQILGACNPQLARQALSENLSLGLLLPCNVIVYENDDGTIEVSAINPRELFTLVDDPKLLKIMNLIDARLRSALHLLDDVEPRTRVGG